MAQLRRVKDDIEKEDAVVICVLPLDMVRTSAFKKTRTNGEFMVLSDPTARTCSIYGVANQLMVHSEWVSSPSVFVIDKKGNIGWSHIGKSYNDRPSAEAVLEKVREVNEKK